MRILAWIKKIRNQGKPYCYECGRDRHTFFEPDVVSRLVMRKTGKDTEYLCYDCFCAVCKRIGLPDIWELTSCQGSSQDLCRTARGGKKQPPKVPQTLAEAINESARKLEEGFAAAGRAIQQTLDGEDVGDCG